MKYNNFAEKKKDSFGGRDVVEKEEARWKQIKIYQTINWSTMANMGTGPDSAVVTGCNPERGFKERFLKGGWMTTTPSYLSLTSNRVTTNY